METEESTMEVFYDQEYSEIRLSLNRAALINLIEDVLPYLVEQNWTGAHWHFDTTTGLEGNVDAFTIIRIQDK